MRSITKALSDAIDAETDHAELYQLRNACIAQAAQCERLGLADERTLLVVLSRLAQARGQIAANARYAI